MFSPRSSQFVDNFHAYGYWNIFKGGKYDNLKKIVLVGRLILYTVLSMIALKKITSDGVASIMNGTLLYIPLLSYTWIIPIMLFVKRKHLVELLHDLDACWESLRDPEDLKVFNYFDVLLARCTSFIGKLMKAQLCFYIILPIAFDTVFHYALDWLTSPFIISYPHMSFLGNNVTWSWTYYAVVVSGWYCIVEMEMALIGWVFMYANIIGFCYPVIKITKKAVKDLRDSDSPAIMEKAVKAHRLLVKPNMSVKKFLGLPCAFQTTFTSLTLTMTLFTTVVSTDLMVLMAYGSGFVLYFLSGLAYCSLGQILENESEDLFDALYNAPWYNYGTAKRKDIQMMIRQAEKPFTIDYNGKYRMDLENFMEILKNAYSFFTLLQTITS